MTMRKPNLPRALLLLAVVAGSISTADTAAAKGRNIAGSIYEDILADGSSRSDPKIGGVQVRLYIDSNNNGVVDAGDDAILEQHTTIGSGIFNFWVETKDTGEHYLVVVNSRDVVPEAGFNGGFDLSDVWAQQTLGDDPITAALDVGPRFGGRTPGVADDFNPGSTLPADNNYQHVGRADVSGTHVINMDFGFSFNVVTNTLDASTPVQGSLRQFMDNANAITDDNAMRFVPAVAANASGGGGQWWRIYLAAVLPVLSDAGTTVDGTAYDPASGTVVLDTNPGVLGTGGVVGTAAVPLTAVARSELEVIGSAATPFGLRIQADLTTVRNLSLHSFSSSVWSAVMGNILVEAGAGTIIEQNVLGSGPGSLSDPGAGLSVPIITLTGTGSGTLRGNLIGYSDRHGIEARTGADGWLIEGNEIFTNGQPDGTQNGVSLDGCSNFTVTGNLVRENGGAGVDVAGGSNSITLEDNTVRGNGIAATGGAETAGLLIGAGGTLVQGNILAENYGAGVLVATVAGAVTITRNSISGNGTIVNLGGGAPTGQIGIDLLGGGDNPAAGTAPFVTLNDSGDTDAGANGLLNFPVLEMALNVGGELTLSGWARPGSVIEVFVAAVDPSGLGEGETFVTTLTEGSALDLDGTVSAYGPLPVNGITVGQDNTNRFQFVIPLPAGVATGTMLTTTATVGGSTSEFGGVATVISLIPIIQVSKTTSTESDPVNLLVNPKAIPGAVVMNTIAVVNTGPGAVDPDALTVTDPIPVNTAVFVGDLAAAGSGPVEFVDGVTPAGISYTFGGLADLADDLEFSSDGGATWNYVPVPDALGFDPMVTHVRVVPKGAFAASDGVNHPGFSLSFRTRVE